MCNMRTKSLGVHQIFIYFDRLKCRPFCTTVLYRPLIMYPKIAIDFKCFFNSMSQIYWFFDVKLCTVIDNTFI